MWKTAGVSGSRSCGALDFVMDTSVTDIVSRSGPVVKPHLASREFSNPRFSARYGVPMGGQCGSGGPSFLRPSEVRIGRDPSRVQMIVAAIVVFDHRERHDNAER